MPLPLPVLLYHTPAVAQLYCLVQPASKRWAVSVTAQGYGQIKSTTGYINTATGALVSETATVKLWKPKDAKTARFPEVGGGGGGQGWEEKGWQQKRAGGCRAGQAGTVHSGQLGVKGRGWGDKGEGGAGQASTMLFHNQVLAVYRERTHAWASICAGCHLLGCRLVRHHPWQRTPVRCTAGAADKE
jgi:hypothetical protein